ncbi:MAG: hypothetical protein Q9160_007311 [Pyrenula sp. 1 TL-2023]
MVAYNTNKDQYSRQNKPFILPNLFTGHEVILPMKDMPWLLRQPNHILNQHQVNFEFMRADYTMLDHRITAEKRLATFIRHSLTHDLESHLEAVLEEIDLGLREFCGTDKTTPKRVQVFDVMIIIVGRIVSRVLVGLPLCRDPAYINASTHFAKSIVITAGLVNMLPGWLRPILGPLITVYDRMQSRKLTNIILPLVRKRAAAFHRDADSSGPKSGATHPNDYITWALHDSLSNSTPPSTSLITSRLIVLSFAGIHSTAITLANALFDIAAHPSSPQLQHSLRNEAHAAKPPNGWTRAAISKLPKTDSLFRESLRLWGIGSHGVTKAVVGREGVRLSSGEYLPYGAKVGIASYGPHHDERVYPGPERFEPERFLGEDGDGEDDDDISNAPRSFVTTGPYFLAFSHGRNSCPGRFFASQHLKLLLAEMMLRYDIEPLPLPLPLPLSLSEEGKGKEKGKGKWNEEGKRRPENLWINNTLTPPGGVGLRFAVREKGMGGRF